MSVFTTDTPARHAAPARTEFCVYFAIIFLAALPLALVSFLIAAVRNKPNRGVVARAWTHAREIAPIIFSA